MTALYWALASRKADKTIIEDIGRRYFILAKKLFGLKDRCNSCSGLSVLARAYGPTLVYLA
jgi:hypothetical protein